MEKESTGAFKNKYAASLSTSIHFFDHTAHNYLRAICEDMHMKHVGSFSADMLDLLKDGEREKLVKFADNFFEAIKNKSPVPRFYKPIDHRETEYAAGKDAGDKIRTDGKRIIILTDCADEQSNLHRMTKRFKSLFSDNIEVINIRKMDIKGGCLGCLHCALDNVCIYHGKDEFADVYDSKIRNADIIVFAGGIKDRYLSSVWKMFFDRTFYYTFIPSLREKQIGFIISGPLRDIPDIREIFEAYTECEEANLVDFVTDEYEDSSEIDALLRQLAERLVKFSDERYIKPPTFLAVGGMKILRDDTWGRFRFILQGNHRYYKKYGKYDFPQRDIKQRAFNAIMMTMTKLPIFRRKFVQRITNEIVRPHKKVLKGL